MDINKLQTKLNDLLASSDDKLTVLIKDLYSGEEWFAYDAEKAVVSASLIKVPIMLAVLEKVREGCFQLNDKLLVREGDIFNDNEIENPTPGEHSLLRLIELMITVSENTSTNILIKTFGFDYINEYITGVLGLKKTKLERYMLDSQAVLAGKNNYTSQNDMYLLYQKLYQKKILNEQLCDLAIRILEDQKFNDQLSLYFPIEYKFAHKTGSLAHLSNDAGVLSIGDRLLYLGSMAYSCKDVKGNNALNAILGQTVLLTYNEETNE